MGMPKNPPAFSQSEWSFHGGDGREGMTLRDWFAGQALAGLFANVKITEGANGNADMAEAAYCAADAMLTARATGSPQ